MFKLNAQWIKTNGPFGGTTVSCFAKAGNKLYAGDTAKFASTLDGVLKPQTTGKAGSRLI